MSEARKFTEEQWSAVKSDLRGSAKSWWDEHRQELLDLTVAEVRDAAGYLKRGDPVSAKLVVVQGMSDTEWEAYRDGTTERLTEIARRRHKIATALGELGLRVAKILGNAILSLLGSVVP